MRIIGHIPHPVVKITVFHLNMKYAVKLELATLEQTYKIRESDEINGLASIAKLTDEAFIDQCLDRFHRMSKDLGEAFSRSRPPEET